MSATGATPSSQDTPGSPPADVPVAERPAYPGPLLRTAGDYAWRLLVLGIVGYFVVKLMTRLSLVVIPFVVSLLVTAFLRPIMDRQRRFGLPRVLATLATVLAAVGVLGGLVSRRCHPGRRAGPSARQRDQQPDPADQALADQRSAAAEPHHGQQPLADTITERRHQEQLDHRLDRSVHREDRPRCSGRRRPLGLLLDDLPSLRRRPGVGLPAQGCARRQARPTVDCAGRAAWQRSATTCGAPSSSPRSTGS